MKHLLSLPGWLALGLLLSCADRATIGALCPVGCELRARESICDCSAKPDQTDAGATVATPDAGCSGADCGQPAAGSGGESAAGSGAACQRKQLDLIVVLDDGASLAPWWPALSEGLKAFLKEDASRGIGLGMLRFGEACDPLSYLPPMIPIEPLPDNLAALEAAIPSIATTTNSTIPALDAAERYAKNWSTDHPEARVAVLLLTDASPGGCDGLSGNYQVEAARVAQAAHLSSPSIKTYVVGAGSFDLVNDIARAGGTDAQRIPITPTSADALNALRTIRSIELSRACQIDP
jgi:hypothetical protein